AGGDPAFVPPFDTRKLLDTDFRSGRLVPPAPLTRHKGWRASPICDKSAADALSVRALPEERAGALGLGPGAGAAGPAIGDGAAVKEYRVERFLGSTQSNVNFPIGNGLGVAVVVEKTSAGTLTLTGGPHRAFLRLHSVALDFSPRQRDENVVD